jgi:hypothetical protein
MKIRVSVREKVDYIEWGKVNPAVGVFRSSPTSNAPDILTMVIDA